MARQWEQPIRILQQDNSFACDLARKLSMLLHRKISDLDRLIEETKCEHGAQDPVHLVVKCGDAHLPCLDGLH